MYSLHQIAAQFSVLVVSFWTVQTALDPSIILHAAHVGFYMT